MPMGRDLTASEVRKLTKQTGVLTDKDYARAKLLYKRKRKKGKLKRYTRGAIGMAQRIGKKVGRGLTKLEIKAEIASRRLGRRR